MSLPYFPMYVDDFEADTAHLTIEEDGAYNRLLRLCWRTPGCSVPDDAKWIMRKMRVSADDYYRVVEPIIDEYFTRGMGRVFSPRLQREHDRTQALHEQKSRAGKASAKARALKTKETKSNSVDVPLQQPEPEPEPEPKGVNPLTPFSEFWAVWPNKTAKKNAEKAWKKLNEQDRRAVLSLPGAGFEAWRRQYPDANPIHPASFLNGRRWEDQPFSGRAPPQEPPSRNASQILAELKARGEL